MVQRLPCLLVVLAALQVLAASALRVSNGMHQQGNRSGSVAWKISMPNLWNNTFAEEVAHVTIGNTVYFSPGNLRSVVAVDAIRGQVLWTTPLPYGFLAFQRCFETRLFAIIGDGRDQDGYFKNAVAEFELTTGNFTSFPFGKGAPYPAVLVCSQKRVKDGEEEVLFGATGENYLAVRQLFALNRSSADGSFKLKWLTELPHQSAFGAQASITKGLTEDGSTLFASLQLPVSFGSRNNTMHFYAVDAASGAFRWKHCFPEERFNDVFFEYGAGIYRNRLLVPSNHLSKFFLFDGRTGHNESFYYDCQGIENCAIEVAQGVLLSSLNSTRKDLLVARNLSTFSPGQHLWNVSLKSAHGVFPDTTVGGRTFLSFDSRYAPLANGTWVYQSFIANRDPSTGALRWNISAPGRQETAAPTKFIAMAGKLEQETYYFYYQTKFQTPSSGDLYAMDPKTGHQIWSIDNGGVRCAKLCTLIRSEMAKVIIAVGDTDLVAYHV